MIRFRVLAHALAAAATLAVCAGAGAQPATQSLAPGAGGPMPADCPPGRPSRQPPRYPQSLVDQDATVVVLLKADRCGFVQDALWEVDEAANAEPEEAFVRAALDAAKKWRLPPLRTGESLEAYARAPVEFISPSYLDYERCDQHRKRRRDPVRPVGTLAVESAARLTVDVNECGWVDSITVAASSGYSSLDRAALDAVKTWKFERQERDGAFVSSQHSVTVEFPKENLEAIEAAGRRWRKTHVDHVAIGVDGKIDGYVSDPQPITGDTIEIIERLRREAVPVAVGPRNVRAYREWGDEIILWYVMDRGASVPALIRFRNVSDGKKQFAATRWRCEAGEGKCDGFEGYLKKGLHRQMPRPPIASPYEPEKPDVSEAAPKMTWRRKSS